MDLNAATSTDELLEAVHLWPLELFWPAATPAEQLLALGALREALEARRVVASVQTGHRVPLGLRVSLVLLIRDDRVQLHDETGRLGAEMDPEDLLVALAAHTGAWVLEHEDDGLSLAAGDADTLGTAVEAAAARTGEGVDPFFAPAASGVLYGEDDAGLLGLASKHGGLTSRLHRDVALLGGDVDAVSSSLAIPGRPGARLLLISRETWATLSYFSPEAMALKVKASEEREPTLNVTLGLTARAFPAPETPAGAADTPAARLAAAVGSAAFAVVPEDAAVLEGAMSQVRAEQAVASLARCVPGSDVARTPLAQAPWLQEWADAVEMLGFDPAWVRVLVGLEPEPDGGLDVEPVGVLGAMKTGIKQEFAKEVAAEREAREQQSQSRADGPSNVATDGAARQAASRGPRPSTRYTIGIVELLLAAGFLFLSPLPLTWLNPVLAALFTLDGVRQVYLGSRAETRERAAGQAPSGGTAASPEAPDETGPTA